MQPSTHPLPFPLLRTLPYLPRRGPSPCHALWLAWHGFALARLCPGTPLPATFAPWCNTVGVAHHLHLPSVLSLPGQPVCALPPTRLQTTHDVATLSRWMAADLYLKEVGAGGCGLDWMHGCTPLGRRLQMIISERAVAAGHELDRVLWQAALWQVRPSMLLVNPAVPAVPAVQVDALRFELSMSHASDEVRSAGSRVCRESWQASTVIKGGVPGSAKGCSRSRHALSLIASKHSPTCSLLCSRKLNTAHRRLHKHPCAASYAQRTHD